MICVCGDKVKILEESNVECNVECVVEVIESLQDSGTNIEEIGVVLFVFFF